MKTYLDQLCELGKQAREYIVSQIGTGRYFAQNLDLESMEMWEIQEQLPCFTTTTKHGDTVEYAIKTLLPVEHGFEMELIDLEDLSEETLPDYYLDQADYCNLATTIQLSKVITM